MAREPSRLPSATTPSRSSGAVGPTWRLYSSVMNSVLLKRTGNQPNHALTKVKGGIL